MGPGALSAVLAGLSRRTHPNVLVGLQTSDDAAVYKLSDELALIQTVDFFTPIVDDPYTYGAIAAANSMSDVYAMGGEVLMALNVAAFPESLPRAIIERIFEGGADKVAEVGAVIAGGHTVTDDEPKYGLSVTGSINPQRILTKAGARPGDALYLTKPIGTGVITTALKSEAAGQADVDAAVQWMLRVNRAAARLALSVGVHACTDITGFGLIGHASEVAEKSGVLLAIDAGRVPLLDGAPGYAEAGFIPGGGDRNRAHFSRHVQAHGVSRTVLDLLYDPQTSGGLLLSLPQQRAARLEAAFANAGEALWRIGGVEAGSGLTVRA